MLKTRMRLSGGKSTNVKVNEKVDKHNQHFMTGTKIKESPEIHLGENLLEKT